MKSIAFEVRGDETHDFEETAQRFGMDITYFSEPLTTQNMDLIKGYDGITTLGRSDISSKILDKMKEEGVSFLATRTIGYNHIDLNYAKEIGIRVSNSQYAPNGVAEYTIMLLLMSLRHYKQALFRGNVNDYSLR